MPLTPVVPRTPEIVTVIVCPVVSEVGPLHVTTHGLAFETPETGSCDTPGVTFAPSDKGRRQPLLVTGVTPQDVVAVTWEGGDLYSFSYLFDGTLLKPSQRAWYTEAPVRIAAGRSHDVQVDLVTQLGMVYITVDGSPAFSLLYPVAPPNIVRIGSAPVGLTTTAGFAGSIERLPVPTPICNTLEHDR